MHDETRSIIDVAAPHPNLFLFTALLLFFSFNILELLFNNMNFSAKLVQVNHVALIIHLRRQRTTVVLDERWVTSR